ncbi:uncharacterized protein KY384_005877 [Bacidia gigantensis]|uniref:uncharacterized protein n=1 Tax=Bacidia gigantensis TaxID=2732470 RepID=UPI001D047797|nr:uncharacterized protein KY384_005877 [Bacidia gigantensis]KAG8529242.1 hypothetical protein KY384_005877 [Bacidia gigantensis]
MLKSRRSTLPFSYLVPYNSRPSLPRAVSTPLFRTFRPPHTDRSRPFTTTAYSSTGHWSTAAFAAIFSSGAFVFYKNHKAAEGPAVPSKHIGSDLQEEEIALMSGTPLPGRPGNLTPDQEAKLQDFWVALLHTFGVPDLADGDHTAVTNSSTDHVKESTDTIASDKQNKKKSGGLFGSKKGKDAKHGGLNGASVVEGEDKFELPPEQLRQAFWSMVKHDNPDALLLRFLRARKWNIQNALVMLIATMKWRMAEVKVDSDIIRRGEAGALEDSQSADAKTKRDGHDFLEQMRIGKSFLHGMDKEGRPICFVRVKLHRAGEQTESSLERYTVYTIESARLLLHDNVDTAAIVFDMTDFSLANMDYAPVKFMIKCFEANYPESLGVVLVHKSPWIFQSIWKIIKGWLDPVVAAKVHFTKNIEELSQFVALEHLLKEMGGKEDWDYKYVPPREGENEKMKDEGTRERLLEERRGVVIEYETTTQQWLSGHKKVEGRRRDLTEKLGAGYWDLDPFLRARTFYDRTGIISPGGGIDFYPSRKKAEPVANGGPIPAGHVDEGVD